MPRRMLHAIASLGGGGAERQLGYLSGELVRRGWDVHIAFRATGPNEALVAAGGAKLHHIGSTRALDPTAILRMAALLRRVRPDLVQTWLPQSDVVAGTAATLLRIPWILTERSAAAAYPKGWRDDLRSVVARRAVAIVANSEVGIAYWRQRLGPHANDRVCRVIPNGVCFDAAPRVRDGKRQGLVGIGRIVQREKNVFGAALAMRAVGPRYGVTLEWCGDGPDRDRLCELVSFYDLSSYVRTRGYCADVGERLRSARAFVSASFFEGQPNAVLEAMASGCPVVVSDIPAHRAILDDQSALFFDPASPTELAAALVKTLNDPESAEHRAVAARRRVEEHSVPSMADAYEALYDTVLAGRRRP